MIGFAIWAGVTGGFALWAYWPRLLDRIDDYREKRDTR